MPAGPLDVDALIGQNIRAIRAAAGVTLAELADRINAASQLGWGDGQLSRIENGQRRLRVGEVVAIASALGVGVGRLLHSPEPLAEPFAGWTGADMARVASSPRVNPAPDPSLDPAAAALERERAAADILATITKATGLPERVVMQRAMTLWGSPPLDERERRYVRWAFENPDPDRSESGAAQRRAAITRTLCRELEANE